MREVLQTPISTKVEPNTPNSQKESTAQQLQGRLYQHLHAMSAERRADLYGRTHEQAAKNGLHLRTYQEGKLVTAPVPFIPIPAFLDRDRVLKYAQDVQLVYGVLLRIEELAFSESELGKEILQKVLHGLSKEQAELVQRAKKRSPETARNRNSRADTLMNNETMNIIEVNNVDPEGIGFHHGMIETSIGFLHASGFELTEGQWMQLGTQRETTAAYQALSMFGHEMQRRNGQLQKIGIVYDQEPPNETVGKDPNLLNRSEIPELQGLFHRISGGKVTSVRGGPSDVSVSDGEIAVKGEKVDIIWRNEIDMSRATSTATTADFIKVVSNPDIYPILNDEASVVIGSKAMLSLLFDERVSKAISMTNAEKKAITRSVPFAFIPGADVYINCGGEEIRAADYLKNYKDNYLLKPLTGTHGERVMFGPNGGQAWIDAVDMAVETRQFIAQKFVPNENITVPMVSIYEDGCISDENLLRDVNLHKIGRTTAGTSISRVAVPEGDGKMRILNVAKGGGLQTTLLVA